MRALAPPPSVSPGLDSRTRRHMWVESVVGSCPCSERFFSGYSGFPLTPQKPTLLTSNSIWEVSPRLVLCAKCDLVFALFCDPYYIPVETFLDWLKPRRDNNNKTPKTYKVIAFHHSLTFVLQDEDNSSFRGKFRHAKFDTFYFYLARKA